MTLSEIRDIHDLPFFELLKQARAVHEENWPDAEVQLCTLLSIKTGGCAEDCGYCAQSARHGLNVPPERLLDRDTVMKHAKAAHEGGSTRFCMGAAWTGVRKGTSQFEEVKEMIRDVSDLGMEVCVTLGKLGEDEAGELADAGVTAYNHNIDTSPEHYPNIVSTHTFEDRIETIGHVQEAGMKLCCGGILGMGEGKEDRLRVLEVLASFDPQPESVPINQLVPIPGTPLEDAPPLDSFDLVRMVATARIILPKSKVRLSAGRTNMTRETQALCYFAGANSIFAGDKLLTARNPARAKDLELLETLDLKPQELASK